MPDVPVVNVDGLVVEGEVGWVSRAVLPCTPTLDEILLIIWRRLYLPCPPPRWVKEIAVDGSLELENLKIVQQMIRLNC